MSIVWTESHFKPNALSRVKASGLMQVMPKTAEYLEKKMLKNHGIDLSKSSSNEKNIEMGIFYLSQLSQTFRNNLKFVIVAYNMGPNWVKKRLRKKRHVGVKNLYLNKVVKNYYKLIRNYKIAIRREFLKYKQTYVYRNRAALENQKLQDTFSFFLGVKRVAVAMSQRQ